jgi:4-diphosphocytidyl-2-C-methyl-D-erythritol kinase
MPLTRASPCKVNLLLNILGKRSDGFHELETLLHPVGLCDELEFAPATHGVELTCDHPELSCGPSNLVVQAAQAFFQESGIRSGVRLRLIKRIPLAAGLGGGSSNAANTLRGLNELFDGPLSEDVLFRLAAQLGSDVPFFLQTKPAVGLGRGEQITPVESFSKLQSCWILLLHPGFGVSTAWAYQSLARFPQAFHGRPGRARQLVDDLLHQPLSQAVKSFFNSLEAPVLHKYPILALFQQALQDSGALATLMSGSGSTTFALAENQAHAEAMSQELLARFGPANWIKTVPI